MTASEPGTRGAESQTSALDLYLYLYVFTSFTFVYEKIDRFLGMWLNLRVLQKPIEIISLGAGVQSSAMALMAAAGEITPMPVAAIFADTQAEPKSVYVWLDWLEKQLPFPVHRVTRGSLEDESTTVFSSGGKTWTRLAPPAFMFENGKCSGPLMRQCTRDSKLRPLIKETNRLRNKQPAINWIGISADESLRMKESRTAGITHRWPLVEIGMTRTGCKKWMLAHSFPVPMRSACVFCPYHSDSEWRFLKVEMPDQFVRAVAYEIKLQKAICAATGFRGKPFLHRSGKPLSEVDFSTEEERGQLNMFNNECEGMCGV
jgi:hypothetical protein